MKSTHLKSSGFTLIELLVVIAIIAILGAISISVFSGAQGSAKDGQRRSEINSIAKSIEASKDFVSNKYKWDATTAGADFPKGIPYNGPKGSASEPYCIKTDTNATPSAPVGMTTNTFAATCNDGYATLTTSVATTTTNNLGATTPDVTSWTLCTRLERSSKPYCISSLTSQAPTPTP